MILQRHADSAPTRAHFGITGHPTHAVDGTINRFGWKAQNKSLTIFSGEAYNVEVGVTNELFTQPTDETAACNVNKPSPNDVTRVATDDLTNDGFNNPLHEFADWIQFAFWMSSWTDRPRRRCRVTPLRWRRVEATSSPNRVVRPATRRR